MSASSDVTERAESLVSLPATPVAYVAVAAAVVAGAIHLLLAPQAIGLNQTMALLFFLNGLGFLGGAALFVSRYWRRDLYLVAAGYALVTIVAYFALSGRVSAFAWISKTAEAVLVVAALSLYRIESSA